MSVGSFVDGVLAGLGLFLLGAWLAKEGAAGAAGDLLRRVLSERLRDRWHAWSLGALAGIGMPISETSSRSLAGLVNTGLVTPLHALWAAAGHGAGVACLAWLFALLSRTTLGTALALALVAGGVTALWTGPDRARGAIGRILAGWGLLLLGMTLLADGFEFARGVLRLDGFAGAPGGSELVLGVVGIAFAVALRSAGASAALAAAAASAGVITPVSGVAMALGAAFGSASGALLALDRDTPAARRSALGLIALHGVGLVSGCAMLACTLPLLVDAPGMLSDPALSVALVLTLALAGPALVLRACELRLVVMLEERFLAEEQDAAAAQHVDGSLRTLPDLALQALLREARRQLAVARRLAASVLRREPVTARREQDDRDALRALAQIVEQGCSALARQALSERAATALPGVVRASEATWELGEQSVFLNSEGLAAEGPLGTTLEARVMRLQLDIARMLEGADPASSELEDGGCEAILAAIESRVHELRALSVERCGQGALDAVSLDRSIERLSTLRRIAQLAANATQDLQRALRPEAATVEETAGGLETAAAPSAAA